MIRILLTIPLFFMNPLMATERAWYFTPSDVNSLHSDPADVRIPYGNDPLQFGDLRLPQTSGLHPVAIIIHGGCWLSTFADLKNTAALADSLRKMGIATWNVEYRRIDHDGGGWPGTFNDVANATDFLRKIDKKYSLDLNKVIAIGHSSGGHLALWLAGRHRLPTTSILYQNKPLVLRGVISLGGVTDLQAFREKAFNICGMDVIASLLGGDEKQIERHYYETSPIKLLPFGIPQRLICGKDDLAIDKPSNKAYVLQAKKLEDNAKLVQIKFAGHHEYNVPNSVTWGIIRKEVLDILDIKLK